MPHALKKNGTHSPGAFLTNVCNVGLLEPRGTYVPVVIDRWGGLFHRKFLVLSFLPLSNQSGGQLSEFCCQLTAVKYWDLNRGLLMRPNTSSIPLKRVKYFSPGRKKDRCGPSLPPQKRRTQFLFIVPIFEQGGSEVLVS